MKALTELGKYATDIKGKAAVGVRVVAEADTGEIVLFVAGSENRNGK